MISYTLFFSAYSEKEENGYEDAEENKIGRKFYGPATNCDELGMLGYTLNGFYIVKGKDLSTSINKIEVVYCRFSQPRHHLETKEGIFMEYANLLL